MKDKTKTGAAFNVPRTEKRIKELIQAIEAIKQVQVTGIRVRYQHVRVHTFNEKQAALLRINEDFEGSRTRDADWHRIKIDDVGQEGHC